MLDRVRAYGRRAFGVLSLVDRACVRAASGFSLSVGGAFPLGGACVVVGLCADKGRASGCRWGVPPLDVLVGLRYGRAFCEMFSIPLRRNPPLYFLWHLVPEPSEHQSFNYCPLCGP